MSLFAFGGKSSDRISISFDSTRPPKKVGSGANEKTMPIFEASEPVVGTVGINVDPGKRIEHLGIKIELIGLTEMFHDRGNANTFTTVVRELAIGGVLVESAQYPFDFTSAAKPYESYNGINVRVRYFIRVTISRNYSSNYVKEDDFIVQKVESPPEAVAPIKMEVGIEECLHIEFEYDKQSVHLQDVVTGKVFFLLVRIKIKHMELNLLRREHTGSGQHQLNESETLTRFELMDGAPVRGERIPIRLFLANLDLTPTYKSISNKFNVKYYLNLVLVDQEDRRYFKQQEVALWRKEIS